MAKRFACVSFGILCLVAAYQLGAERAGAEWDAGAPGQIIGGAFAQGGPWVAFTAGGEAWSVTPAVGWIRRQEFDLPVSSSAVKFLDSNGEVFVLITTTDEVWQLVDNGFGWYPLDPFPGGPIATQDEAWGTVKGKYR